MFFPIKQFALVSDRILDHLVHIIVPDLMRPPCQLFKAFLKISLRPRLPPFQYATNHTTALNNPLRMFHPHVIIYHQSRA
jgi:hypothetical protein